MILLGIPPVDELKVLGEEMRAYAVKHPCLVIEDAALPAYYRMVALNYHVCVVLESYKRPACWHGSVSVLHDTVRGSDETLGIPEQAVINIREWPLETRKIAREILGYVLGPVIVDPKQVVKEQEGLFSLHWFTEAEWRSDGRIIGVGA